MQQPESEYPDSVSGRKKAAVARTMETRGDQLSHEKGAFAPFFLSCAAFRYML